VSLLADYFVICSANNERQINAILQDVIDEIRSTAHRRPTRQEGQPSSGWVLLDYGDVVAHIFAPAEREYYRLEDLWADASPVLRIQ
jgi:ribosome-associated protein